MGETLGIKCFRLLSLLVFLFSKVFIFSYSYPFSSSFLLFTLPRRFNDFFRDVAILFSRKKIFDSRFNTFEIQMQLNKSMRIMVNFYTPFSYCFTFVQYHFVDRLSSMNDRVIWIYFEEARYRVDPECVSIRFGVAILLYRSKDWKSSKIRNWELFSLDVRLMAIR